MKDDFRAFSVAFQFGLNMLVTIFLCLFIGKWIDKKLGTNPVFLLIFIVLGILASFRNLYVSITRASKKAIKNKQQNIQEATKTTQAIEEDDNYDQNI